ncbi:MAG: gluconate 2-dehydrogenase subunit 3 family protein [Cyclobacteriaceae bacterium]|nr:gluconate 2-dehydrogenase subunit 3 family protein [Cyclobacteriaceae bacterium]
MYLIHIACTFKPVKEFPLFSSGNSMNRRLAIKQAALLGGAVAFFSSCSEQAKKASIALQKLNLNAKDEELLMKIVEAILPASSSPGAARLNVHHFVLIMVDDCLSPQDQKVFVDGLYSIDAFCKRNFGKRFEKSDKPTQAEMLTAIQNNQDLKEKKEGEIKIMKSFVGMCKRYSLQGFMGSEYYLTQIMPYELVPGRYHGCVPV